jgi:signal peptidase I
MNIFTTPTLNNSGSTWEGDTLPPLRMAEEKPVQPQTPPAVPAAPRAGLGLRYFVWFVVMAVTCVGVYTLASRYLVTAVLVQGRSMMPTLQDGETYLLHRWMYYFREPRHGDLVVIRDPGHDDFAVKRIVACPSDAMELREGRVYLNGRKLHEPYLGKGVATFTADSKQRWIELGKDQFYVLGDNRAVSEDSRFYGMVKRGHILGLILK